MRKLAKGRQRKNPGINRTRQRALAVNLAKGMAPEPAMIDAGYSPTTARKKAFQVIRQPVIQSLLTESCQRIMQKREMEFDAILEPYFDGLKAAVIVKSTQLGDAQIPKDPATGEPFPDHHTRMAAADRLIEFHRPKGTQAEDNQPPPAPPVNIQVRFIKPAASRDPIPSSLPTPSAQADGASFPVPKVAFVNNRR